MVATISIMDVMREEVVMAEAAILTGLKMPKLSRLLAGKRER